MVPYDDDQTQPSQFGLQAIRVTSLFSMEKVFKDGFQRQARKHQVSAVDQLVKSGFPTERLRFLLQHAPGSGKTETIGLLAWAALNHCDFRHVVILNQTGSL